MSELLIVVALIPLGFLGLSGGQKTLRGGLWLSIAIALVCHGYFLSLHLNAPLIWTPILAFFVMVASASISKKSFPPFSILGAIFIAQALLAQDVATILVLTVLSDMFLLVEHFISAETEEKNRAIGNIYRALISLCPAALAVLLNLPPDVVPVLICLTIILRLFSWPLGHWKANPTDRIHQLIVSAGSTFALWHVLSLSGHPEWSVIWLLVAAVLSLGAGYFEVFLALNLGLFSISPALGVAGTALWPLLVRQTKSIYVVGLGVALIGMLISDFSPHVFLENIDYGLCALCAVALARSFVAPRPEKRLWYFEVLDVVVALAVMALFIYINPMPIPEFGPLAIVFGGVFLASFVTGLLLYSRKPKWFAAAPSFAPKPERFAGLQFFDERIGEPITMASSSKRLRLFEMIEGESHLIWLLGALGAIIIWGRR